MENSGDVQAGVPLLRYTYVAAVLSVLESNNHSITRAARISKLPLLVDDPRSLVPKRPFFRFLDKAWNAETTMAGLDAGVLVAENGDARYLIDAACQPGGMLLDGIRVLIRLAGREANEMPMGMKLTQSGGWLWLRALPHPSGDSYPGLRSNEILPLGVFLVLARRFLGAQWTPRYIELQALQVSAVMKNRFPTTCFKFAQPQMAVWFSDCELQQTLEAAPKQDLTECKDESVTFDLVPGLKAAISTYLLEANETPMSLGLAADFTRCSERTLQRRLSDAGTSFRCVYEQAMTSSAQRFLKDRSLKVSEIAAMHGYDARHFIRAFRRATGITPGRYRQLLAQDKVS